MPRTHFHDFERDDGSPVTVEYTFIGGSETTYSPRFGADGGDPGELEIVDCWPKTAWQGLLAGASLRLMVGNNRTRLGWKLAGVIRRPIDLLMRLHAWWRASLTDAERERMEAWLAEHHVEDFYEPEDC